MTDQPVTPDREWLERFIEETHLRWVTAPGGGGRRFHVVLTDALLPLLTDALDRARREGWRAHWEYVIRGGGSDLGEPGDLDELRARLARGADRKDEG